MPAPDTPRTRAWTRYWSAGALHSCAGSFEGNYSGEVADFWRRFAGALPAGGRVLDLAAGNGPVTRLLLETPGSSLRLDAVDLADVDPDWVRQLPADAAGRVRFHARTPAEHLPFADATFDALASQFGLEYTDWERTLPEQTRVLRAGAAVALVLHDAGSLVLRQAREERTHLDWMAGQGLLGAARGLCPWMALAASPEGRARLQADPAAADARAGLNALLAATADRARTSPCPDVLHDTAAAILDALRACQASGRPEPGQASLLALAEALDDSRLRLEELIASALDAAGVQELVQRAGWQEARVLNLHFPGGERLGWGLRAQAPG